VTPSVCTLCVVGIILPPDSELSLEIRAADSARRGCGGVERNHVFTELGARVTLATPPRHVFKVALAPRWPAVVGLRPALKMGPRADARGARRAAQREFLGSSKHSR